MNSQSAPHHQSNHRKSLSGGASLVKRQRTSPESILRAVSAEVREDGGSSDGSTYSDMDGQVTPAAGSNGADNELLTSAGEEEEDEELELDQESQFKSGGDMEEEEDVVVEPSGTENQLDEMLGVKQQDTHYYHHQSLVNQSNKRHPQMQVQPQQQQQPPHKDFEDVKQVELFGAYIVALTINGKERLCLAQISNTLLKEFSYNEIHNRRVALGITCVQCTPIQLEMLRRAGAMPSSSRRCGMITMREAERLCRSFLVEEQPPELPENFYFTVAHRINYGCKGRFVPARYISSRAKCIECFYCGEFYSPNKFIFHSHRQPNATDCNPPDSPNINSWRKHIDLDWTQEHPQEIKYAWEDVKSLFNGGTRRRAPAATGASFAQIGAANGNAYASQQEHANSSNARTSGSGADSAPDQLIDVDDSAPNCADKSAAGASGVAPGPVESERKLFVRLEKASARRTAPSSHHGAKMWPSLAGSGPRNQPSIRHQPPASNHQHHHDNNNSLILNHSGARNHGGVASGRSSSGAGCKRSPLNASLMDSCASKRFMDNFSSASTNSVQQQHPSVLQMDTKRAESGAGNPLASYRNYQASSSPATTIGAHLHRPPIPVSNNCGQTYPFAPPTDYQQTAPPNNNNNATSGNQTTRAKPHLDLLYPPASSFIYSQLYNQLMQPQAANQQQQIASAVDAQLALRHHLWSSLLANLQCNTAASNQQLQQLPNNYLFQAPAQNHCNITATPQSLAGATAGPLSSELPGGQVQATNLSHLISAQLYESAKLQSKPTPASPMQLPYSNNNNKPPDAPTPPAQKASFSLIHESHSSSLGGGGAGTGDA